MTTKKSGLKRPQVGEVDIYSATPHVEMVDEPERFETPVAEAPEAPTTAPRKKKASRTPAPAARRPAQPGQARRKLRAAGQEDPRLAIAREDRIKSSVEFLPETFELITQLQAEHRQKHNEHYALWILLDDAVRALAKQRRS